MKHAMMLLLLALLAQGILATDIHSTAGGGNWFDTTTWVGDSVPATDDNVFIHSKVYAADAICNNLTIDNLGELVNYLPWSPTLTVNGDLNNAGIMSNNHMNYLIIVAKGNIVNTGTISFQYLYMSGASDQYLSSSVNIRPVNLIDTDATSSVILQSDLVFTNTVLNMNYGTLVLNGASTHDLSLTGGSLLYATIQGGNGATLTTGGNCYLEYVIANELVLQGVVILSDGVIISTLYNYATVYNYLSMISTLTITQRLENRGIIRNNPSMNWLIVNLGGDLYDYGTISCYRLTLTSAGTVNLYQNLAGVPISCTQFLTSSGAGSYQMQSNLRFQSCNVDFAYKPTYMFSGSQGYGITIDGGYFHSADLKGDSSSFLTLANTAYLQYITADELILNGEVIIAEGVSVGKLYNNATVYNYVSMISTLNVTQRLENHGSIRNNPSMNWLYLNLGGDLYNYTSISAHTINFVAAPRTSVYQIHNVFQHTAALPFTSSYFTVLSDSGNLQLLSDLTFFHCIINLNGKTMYMSQNRASYGLIIQGGWLYWAVLDTNGFSTLELSDGAYLDYVTAEDIILRGTIIIVNSVEFDDVVNYGTVYNYISNIYNMICNGNLVNYGTFRNNPGMNYLYLYCRKDLTNYGAIQTQQTLIDGAADQYILIGDGSSISCPGGFNLVSELGSAQWYFNGNLNNPGYYSVLTVNPTELGVWQPFDGNTFGRNIILGNGLPVSTPLNLVIFPQGTEYKLQWSEVENAIYYTVYACSDPYGTFVPLEDKVFDSNRFDGIVWMDFLPTAHFRFFKVSAGN